MSVDSVADAVQLAQRLVRVPSVNPMGRPVSGEIYGELRLTEELLAVLSAAGLSFVRQVVGPQQDNVVIHCPGVPAADAGGLVILFDAHQDTVPVDGMTVDPFGGTIQRGRLYGRGACDVKGPMAAMLAAVLRLAEERPPRRPTVIFSLSINEEYGFTGIRKLVELWSTPGREPVLPRPDLAVVAEPTGLQIVAAHKGVLRWRCHAPGRAAHSSRPELGENAIYRMARALGIMERFDAEVLAAGPVHRWCGRSTLSVGTIQGGASANMVPARCTIEVERRFPPGEDADRIQPALVDYLRAAELGFELQHDPPYMRGLALPEAENHPLVERLQAITAAAAGDCQRIGVPYATNGAFVAAVGIPTVVFGPGQIEQAHTVDEWIDVEQLALGAEIYYQFLREVQ